MYTFPVDDVIPAGSPLPVRPVGELFPDALAVGGDASLPVLEPDGIHPLLSAVARAFADHRPLLLSPDAVWLTIFELADGRTIASAVDMSEGTESWVVCRLTTDGTDDHLVGDLADVPVLGASLAALLDAAMDADGDLVHLETGRLARPGGGPLSEPVRR